MSDHNHEAQKRVVATALAQIDQSALEMRSSMIAFRRQMHAHPEASGKETSTTQFIVDTLATHGLSATTMPGGTGAILDIPPEPTCSGRIAFRCDIDAVAVDDTKTVGYASNVAGLCHACGHDAHTTIALHAAVLLKDRIPATTDVGLRFIFQPAEEDGTGARFVIDAGGIDGVTAAYAVHVDPLLEVGKVATRKGAMTSACWAFRVTMTGRGGHSARPHEACDPITPLIELHRQLCTLKEELAAADPPMVLCITNIHGGQALNAVPAEASLAGTLRGGDDSALRTICDRIEQCGQDAAAAASCVSSIEFPTTFPATVNDPALADHAQWIGREVFGEDGVLELPEPSMGAEDFAQYAAHVETCMIRLGAALEREIDRSCLHSPGFDLNEEVLSAGVRFVSLLLLTALGLLSATEPST